MQCSISKKIKVLQYIKQNKCDIKYNYNPIDDVKTLFIKKNDKQISVSWDTNPNNNDISLFFTCNLCDNKKCQSNSCSQRKNILEKLFVRKITNKMSNYHNQQNNQKIR